MGALATNARLGRHAARSCAERGMVQLAHRQIDLLCGPEAGLGLLIHLPDLRVLDREENEALLVALQNGLLSVNGVRDVRHQEAVRVRTRGS